MKTEQLNELLYQALETELGGVQEIFHLVDNGKVCGEAETTLLFCQEP